MLSYKSLKYVSLLGIMILGTTLSFAFSITDTVHGNKLQSLDPRALAMGSASAFNDQNAFAISVNPANLTLMKKYFGIQLSSSFTRNEDNRSVPLYNSFDNYVDDAVYSSNTNVFDNYAGAIYASLNSLSHTAGLGFYYKPLLSFDGDYSEQVRNNYGTDNDTYPEIIAMNQINSKGVLEQKGIVYAMGIDLGEISSIHFGFDYSLMDGRIDHKKSILWTDVAKNTVAAINSSFLLPDVIDSMRTRINGYQVKLGTTIKLNNRLGIGIVYTPKAMLDSKGSVSMFRSPSTVNTIGYYLSSDFEQDYILPAEARLGLSYKPQNIMRTWFNTDIEYVQWSDIDKAYDDVFNLYCGVEHHLENRLPLRLGFQAYNSYLVANDIDAEGNSIIIAKNILTPSITGGSSIDLAKNLKLDLGFSYSFREYEALDMFGDTFYNDRNHTGHSTSLLWRNPQYLSFVDRGWENPDKVRENFISLNTALSFTW